MKKIKKSISIGRLQGSDYQLSSAHMQTSRNHARLSIFSDGSLELEDFSSHGTYVNGKIIQNQKVNVNRADIISFANEELLDWNRLNLKSDGASFLKVISYLLPVLGLVAAFAYYTTQKDVSVAEINSQYGGSVGLIVNAYLLTTDIGSNQIYIGYSKEQYNDGQQLELSIDVDKNKLLPFFATGTGFLIQTTVDGDKANLVTNRHVAIPSWQINKGNYSDKEDEVFFEDLAAKADEYEDKLKLKRNPNREYETDNTLLSFVPSKSISTFNKNLTYAQLLDQFDNNATVLRYSEDEAVDIAVLVTNVDVSVEDYLDLDKTSNTNLEIVEVGDQTTILGYSGGLITGFEVDNGLLDYQVADGKISKGPTRFNIVYNATTSGGSSGSPVFDENGKLIAVHYAAQGLKGLGIPVQHVFDVLDYVNVAKPVANGKRQFD